TAPQPVTPPRPAATAADEATADFGAMRTQPAPTAQASPHRTAGLDEATVVHDSASTSARGGATPDRLGGYRILRELGRGAMGTVFLARQISLDRNVALKTIQTRWANHPPV